MVRRIVQDLGVTTEMTLRDWRFGQTQAERLAAGVLAVEGFTSVDPQHPLGGPDGLKDVLCRRGVTSFVAAVYFPGTPVSFASLKTKFESDLAGVALNAARGFVFLVNQKLTVGERDILRSAAKDKTDVTELYHLERLRAVLDSPRGCGLRLEYLNIAMTHEEQLAYWSSGNIDLAAKLDRIESLQLRTIERVEATGGDLLRRTAAIYHDLRAQTSSTFATTQGHQGIVASGPATSSIDVPLLLWLHRLVMAGAGLPETLVGNLRKISVRIEAGGEDKDPYLPPRPEDVGSLLTSWCESWRQNYSQIEASNPEDRLKAIVVAYHEFLRVHPFLDGNGRVARVLLDQMLRELLGTSLPTSFIEARTRHQAALQSADSGDIGPLQGLLTSALS